MWHNCQNNFWVKFLTVINFIFQVEAKLPNAKESETDGRTQENYRAGLVTCLTSW